jgi:hypothetical protein
MDSPNNSLILKCVIFLTYFRKMLDTILKYEKIASSIYNLRLYTQPTEIILIIEPP